MENSDNFGVEETKTFPSVSRFCSPLDAILFCQTGGSIPELEAKKNPIVLEKPVSENQCLGMIPVCLSEKKNHFEVKAETSTR